MIRMFLIALAICAMYLWGPVVTGAEPIDKGACGGVDSAHVFRNKIDSWCTLQNLQCCNESATEAVGFVEIGMQRKRLQVEITWEQLADTAKRKASIKIELIGQNDQVITSKLSPALSGKKNRQDSFNLILDDPGRKGRRLKIIVPSAGDYAIAIRSVIIN